MAQDPREPTLTDPPTERWTPVAGLTDAELTDIRGHIAAGEITVVLAKHLSDEIDYQRRRIAAIEALIAGGRITGHPGCVPIGALHRVLNGEPFYVR